MYNRVHDRKQEPNARKKQETIHHTSRKHLVDVLQSAGLVHVSSNPDRLNASYTMQSEITRPETEEVPYSNKNSKISSYPTRMNVGNKRATKKVQFKQNLQHPTRSIMLSIATASESLRSKMKGMV